MATELRKLGENDLEFASGGAGTPEVTVSPLGKVVTKIDATHLRLRSVNIDVEEVVTTLVGVMTFVITDGGGEIADGIKGDLIMPCSGIIQSVDLLADQSGDIVVDIWKAARVAYPPTNADSITGAAPPTISGDDNSQDAVLSGWDTSFSEGDVFRFNVDSCTTIERCTVAIKFLRTIPAEALS